MKYAVRFEEEGEVKYLTGGSGWAKAFEIDKAVAIAEARPRLRATAIPYEWVPDSIRKSNV